MCSWGDLAVAILNTKLDFFLASIVSSQWLVLVGVAALLLCGAELGYRCGFRLFVQADEARKCQISGVQTATLGLLGLLLGFTFSMAIERFSLRQRLAIDEANVIETTFHQAAFLPEAQRDKVEALLCRYVDLRLAFYDVLGDPARLAEVEGKATAVRDEIWAHAVVTSKGDEKSSPFVEQFVTALAETTRLCATRTAAVHSRVPGAVWLLVLMMSFAGCAVTGYAAGATGKRAVFANMLLPVIVAVVITILVDFSRPADGLTGIDHSSMVTLRGKMHSRTH